jgi:cobyrinic acid a,c-diamide synthase
MKYLFAKNSEGCDISVIEGVMGYYDGLGISSTKSSTYEVARVTDTPVVLIVNARGASLSVLAQIKGFTEFRADSGIVGVILNNCTKSTYEMLAPEIEHYFEGKVKPLGFMPVVKESSLESRHLGLVTAAEVRDLKGKMNLLAERAEECIDLDGIINIAKNAVDIKYEYVNIAKMDEPVRIGIARDRAFCFYYEDSIDILKEMGAELVAFSPLEDEALPQNLDGIYLGGGYPELYLKELNSNKGMLCSIRDAVQGGLPCIAECGGFMYLLENIEGVPMAGALPGGCSNTGKLQRFGYVTITAEKDNMLCKKGESIRAHEFHHYDAENAGSDFTAEKSSGKSWQAAIATDTLYAGYPHFHFYSNPAFAEGFYRACLKRRKDV